MSSHLPTYGWHKPSGVVLLVITLLFLGADLRSAPVARSATAGLVAAYSFDEGTGSSVGDASGNGNSGAINGATWTTQAKFGRALSFNGSNAYVDVGNRSSLRITGSMTWSAWVFATGTPDDDGQIIAKSAGASGSVGSQFKTSPDTGPHTFGVGVSPDGNSITQRFSTTNRNLNTWYYVAGVYDAAARTLHIYVNGVLDDGALVGTVPASQFDPVQNVTIGRRSGGYYFDGTIDEVRVYNRPLTQAEIQADMVAPIQPSGRTRRPHPCRSPRRSRAPTCTTRSTSSPPQRTTWASQACSSSPTAPRSAAKTRRPRTKPPGTQFCRRMARTR